MPLPVHIGTKGYLSPEAAQADELFSRPAAPSLLEGVQLSAASPIAEHLGLTQAFAHPALAHHLGRNAAALSTVDVDADMRVESLLSAAAAKHADAASDAWAAALERLGAKATEPTVSAAEQASIDDAIAGLNGLLARLETADVEDEFVRMDSVRRKRKKKMNKHKYKKRRKVSRHLSLGRIAADPNRRPALSAGVSASKRYTSQLIHASHAIEP
jgi:hypothetical protein